MRFESQWPGDVIAAPACGNFGQENAVFESLDSGSKKWPDARRDRSNAEPIFVLKDWCEPVLGLAPHSSAPRPQRQRVRATAEPDTVARNFTGWRAWITSIASIISECWSRIRGERELRRLGAVWERIDDRTLKDIGISRLEIEYGRDRRHWE